VLTKWKTIKSLGEYKDGWAWGGVGGTSERREISSFK